MLGLLCAICVDLERIISNDLHISNLVFHLCFHKDSIWSPSIEILRLFKGEARLVRFGDLPEIDIAVLLKIDLLELILRGDILTP